MLAYAEFYGDWNEYKNSYRWKKLSDAAAQQRVVIDGQAHRALSDVQMTLGVIRAMATNPVNDEVCDRCGNLGCDGTAMCHCCGDSIACDGQFCYRCASGAV
ncbi:hypothetical protein D3C73_1039750 [compost metagenome]